jgi:hydrogenase nickel incorporation protein HypB
MSFLAAHAVVINKIDLEPYIPAKADRLRANALAVNPNLAVFAVSCLTGQGLDEWLEWVRGALAAKRASA